METPGNRTFRDYGRFYDEARSANPLPEIPEHPIPVESYLPEDIRVAMEFMLDDNNGFVLFEAEILTASVLWCSAVGMKSLDEVQAFLKSNDDLREAGHSLAGQPRGSWIDKSGEWAYLWFPRDPETFYSTYRGVGIEISPDLGYTFEGKALLGLPLLFPQSMDDRFRPLTEGQVNLALLAAITTGGRVPTRREAVALLRMEIDKLVTGVDAG